MYLAQLKSDHPPPQASFPGLSLRYLQKQFPMENSGKRNREENEKPDWCFSAPPGLMGQLSVGG